MRVAVLGRSVPGMGLWECRIDVALGAAGLIAVQAAPCWVVLEDRSSGHTAVVGYFPSRAGAAAAARRLLTVLPPGWRRSRPRLRPLADADWRESYKAHFHPWRLGRMHWAPEWERMTFAPPPGHTVVWLDPGMAFGTGNHEMTRLCCRRLVAYAAAAMRARWRPRGRSPVASRNMTRKSRLEVIDAGRGSGILAISAARLGLGPVVAFDHDPTAVRVSRKNAARNGVGRQMRFRVADLAAGLVRSRAGLVLANIQADVFRRHAGALTRAVAPGGWLVLSGILADERGATRAAFARPAAGWAVDSRVLGEWPDLVYRRPARAQNKSGGVRLRNSSR